MFHSLLTNIFLHVSCFKDEGIRKNQILKFLMVSAGCFSQGGGS